MTLQYTQWQVVTIRLPLAQHEALGWWNAPPGFSRLHLTDFLFHTDASGPRDFWAMRQKKTLALVWVLQACAKESGVSTGILSKSAVQLQNCMAPLITLSSDDIVEVSLLKPMGEEHGTCLTLQEEATLLGEEIKPPPVPITSLEPTEQSTALSASSSSPATQSACYPSSRQRSIGRELMLTQIIPEDWFAFTYRRMIKCQNCGGNSNHLSAPQTKASMMSQSKEWSASKLLSLDCQLHN